MFVSNQQVLGISLVVIKDDEDLPEGCSLIYLTGRVRKKVPWWRYAKWIWILRAENTATSYNFSGKFQIEMDFIGQLPPALEADFSVYHGGMLIKKCGGYLVHWHWPVPDNVTIKLLRAVGLSATPF